MRVFLAEHLEYLLRVAVVFGEDYRLAQLLAVVDLQAVRHKQIERQADGVLVEQPLVESGGLYLIRQLTVFVGEGGLVLGLFVLGQLVVGDALGEEFQLALDGEEVHEETVLYRLGQVVAVGGHAAFELEYLVGVLVYLVLGRGGEADERRVEVGEDIPELVVDGAVGLVADYEVKVADGEELALVVLNRVDAVHHRLVSGEHTPGRIVVLLLAQIRHRQIGQQVHEAALRLRDK